MKKEKVILIACSLILLATYKFSKDYFERYNFYFF